MGWKLFSALQTHCLTAAGVYCSVWLNCNMEQTSMMHSHTAVTRSDTPCCLTKLEYVRREIFKIFMVFGCPFQIKIFYDSIIVIFPAISLWQCYNRHYVKVSLCSRGSAVSLLCKGSNPLLWTTSCDPFAERKRERRLVKPEEAAL